MTKETKGLLFGAAIFVGVTLLIFIGVGFVRWDFSVANWPDEARGIVVFGAAIAGFFSIPAGLTVAGKM